MDLRLRERRLEPPFFELRLAERRDRRDDFLLPPFLADAFLREERLFGAMVTRDYGGVTRDNFNLRGEAPTNNNNEIQTKQRRFAF